MAGKRILEDTDPAVVPSTKKRKIDHIPTVVSSTKKRKIDLRRSRSAERYRIRKIVQEGHSLQLFVRGLYNGTTKTKLSEYFSQYGNIKNINLNNAGLASIFFTEAQAKDKIFEVDGHFLDGRKIFPKRQHPHKQEPSLFVGRLPKGTTVSRVEEYFSKYGEIEHIETRRIQNGNCIIVFTEAQTINKVIEAGEHFMDGTKIITNRKGLTGGKLFLGGLHGNTTESKVRDYFSVYGEISSMNLKIKRGIGFVMFTNAQSLDKILDGEHFLDGNRLITKRDAGDGENMSWRYSKTISKKKNKMNALRAEWKARKNSNYWANKTPVNKKTVY